MQNRVILIQLLKLQNIAKYVGTQKNRYNMFRLPLEDILRGCVMAAAAGGAGSIFQGAQQDPGENSGVGPLPADINMVAPPQLLQLQPTSHRVRLESWRTAGSTRSVEAHPEH